MCKRNFSLEKISLNGNSYYMKKQKVANLQPFVKYVIKLIYGKVIPV